MKKRTPTDSITILDWMKNKPYTVSHDKYDIPYLKLCRGVFDILSQQKAWFDEGKVDRELRKELACMLVSYFEDFISEIGIWKAFIERNKELHGYYLPFYDLSEYDPEYLNVEDFAYLIWHFMTKCLDTRIYAPDHPYAWDLAVDIYELLEPEIEKVYATDFYEDYFTVQDGFDLFEFKEKLDWFSTKSYLMGWEKGKDFKVELQELVDSDGFDPSSELAPILVYALRDDFMYAKRCSFAAMNAPEWFSRVARCSDNKRLEINNLQFRHLGEYLFEGEESLHFSFTHLSTNRSYRVLKDSIKNKKNIGRVGKTCYHMTLVQWDGEWLMTGTMSGWDMGPDEIEKAKLEHVATPWIYTNAKLQHMRETTDLMYKSFVEFFGSPLALFNNHKEMEQGSKDYFNFYNRQLGSTDEEFEQRQKEYQRRVGNTKSMDFSDLPKGNHSYGMLFVEGIGIISLMELQDTLIYLKKANPTKEEEVDLFYDLIANYEPVVAEYLLQNFGNKNFKHPVALSKIDLWRDRHFYWRFFHPQGHGPKYPLMTEVDMG
ncbi:MAG: DUF3843 family protein [Saprospiraceae bacterium]|nr:DUF3843 family protein [Saprospiraceae bacterium]MCF8249373.1 DUF3843 family protein [Saprospiraceae bacterium]MCF8279027.1 DUF3843 family protein [Bacteroidales bacterium]MCF8311502.1 DUF3843 family protein [Saprospiraceae bacterium]MCF8439992.1 DUF3843 family protein [Saprospiraceae bacterium]